MDLNKSESSAYNTAIDPSWNYDVGNGFLFCHITKIVMVRICETGNINLDLETLAWHMSVSVG